MFVFCLSTNQTAGLFKRFKKRLCYIKNVRRHRVTKHSDSQQIDEVFVFGYCEACPI